MLTHMCEHYPIAPTENAMGPNSKPGSKPLTPAVALELATVVVQELADKTARANAKSQCTHDERFAYVCQRLATAEGLLVVLLGAIAGPDMEAAAERALGNLEPTPLTFGGWYLERAERAAQSARARTAKVAA